MTFDRSWIGRNRFNESKYLSQEYKDGVDSFINFSCEHLDKKDGGLIRCPCRNCGNKYFKNSSAVKLDLYRYGIMHWYTRWDLHGKNDMPQDKAGTSYTNIGYKNEVMYDVHDMLREFGEASRHFENFDDYEEEPNSMAKEFYKMLHNASEPIYPSNVNFTTLSFVNKMFHFKNKHKCSSSGFDELIQLIESVLPDGHKLSENYYVVRKIIKGLNMGYEKIDACENDCMLFFKKNSKKTRYYICNESRYKEQKDPKKKMISRKILRYFPITLRLQRLFMAEKTAKCMRWHHDRVAVEGELCHPADEDEWKQFDNRFPNFTKKKFEMSDLDSLVMDLTLFTIHMPGSILYGP